MRNEVHSGIGKKDSELMDASSHFDRARILVIDDDPLLRSLIVSLLRKDCLVSVAAEGSEGFYKALEHPPDIALIDVQMPGWDGLKTVQAFRGHPALAHIPIMMLTGDASKETVLAAIRAGSNDYVIKMTFSKQDFYQKLNRLIPGRVIIPTAATPESVSAGSTATPQVSAVAAPMPAAKKPAASGTDLQEVIDGWE
ncbi:MAG: response regulator [Planctomycetaceae bacterium]